MFWNCLKFATNLFYNPAFNRSQSIALLVLSSSSSCSPDPNEVVFFFRQLGAFFPNIVRWPGDSEGVYVFGADRQPSRPPSSQSNCSLWLSSPERRRIAWPTLACLTGLHRSSGLLGFGLFVCHLHLFSLLSSLLRPLLNCQSRTITACEDVRGRWIRQKVSGSQPMADQTGPPSSDWCSGCS